jgi:hypothetical protein
MSSLVQDMTQDDPTKRPTMSQVVETFAKIRLLLRPRTLRSRVADRDEFFLVAFARDVRHTAKHMVSSSNTDGLPVKASKA